jgi:diguanylate cyclase (GGDEF)-like protein
MEMSLRSVAGLNAKPLDEAGWHGASWPLWLRILVVVAVVAALGFGTLAFREAFAAHKSWIPAGAAIAFSALWGPRVLVGVALGSGFSALWWTGSVAGAVLFGLEQAALGLIAWGLLRWPVPLDMRLGKLSDMARFIVVVCGGYAFAAFLALSIVPEALTHVRGDLASAARHEPHEHAAPTAAHPPAHGSAHAGSQAGAHGAMDHPTPHAEARPAHGHAAPGKFDWALADLVGALLVAPVLLLLMRRQAVKPLADADEKGAYAALLLLTAVSASIYSGWLEATFGLRHTTLLVLPPAVWLALRYPYVYSLLGNLAVVLIADIGTSMGHGPFSDHTSGLPLLHVVFIGTTLLMSASQTERARATAEVQRLATRDSLTNLPNRNLLAVHLETALVTAERYRQRVGVLFIDLDHFKRINDSLGHAVGDQVLVAATERISSVLRQDSVLARVGGDEFVAVMERLDDPEDTSRAAARIIAALEHPFEFESHSLTLSCSVGVAAYPDDGASGSELIKHADIAMYQAKATGRNQFRFFSPAMNDQVKARLEIENGLRAAMQTGALVLHYQPIVHASTGRLEKIEALVRWRRPDGTLVMPNEFIRIAEETGLIEGLGAWVIVQAARQLKAWRAAGLPDVPVCVNLSVRQLRKARVLAEFVQRTLDEHGLSGKDLVLEITESMLLHLGGDAEQALRQLGHCGITLALDDFGTGYSSLGYLARLPIDIIKIDHSFVRDLDGSAEKTLVRAMVDLAHHLSMSVTAEGVETAQQREVLAAMGVDSLQGQAISMPLDAEAFARLKIAGWRA